MPKKVVLVSGGTDGIGKGIVLQLLAEGFNVAAFSRSKEKVNALAKVLKEKYPSSRFLVEVADVTNEKSLQAVIKGMLTQFKTIDILINNAGFGYFSECEKATTAIIEEMIQTNLFGAMLLSKLVVPILKEKKSGLIINIVSSSGKDSRPRGSFYSATKFGLMGYSIGIRKELEPFGIKVCTVCPGMVETSFFDPHELEIRKKNAGNRMPTMLRVSDVVRVVSLVCTQSEHCDIQDVTVMPS